MAQSKSRGITQQLKSSGVTFSCTAFLARHSYLPSQEDRKNLRRFEEAAVARVARRVSAGRTLLSEVRS